MSYWSRRDSGYLRQQSQPHQSETAQDAWCMELSNAIDHVGMKGREFAQAMGVAPSTVSQWLKGKRTPDIEDIRRCDEKLGTNGYLTRYFERWVTREFPSEWADRWLAAERRANLLQAYESSVMPGLLQTENYARAIMTLARHSPIAVEERMRRRLERQQIFRDENPTMCVFVLDEGVLRRNIGGPDVMLEQSEHLRDAANEPYIVVKVVPSGTEYYAAYPFMLAELDGAKVVSIDDVLMGRVIEGNGDVAEVTKIWEDIREAALSPRESLVLIEGVINEWQTQPGGSRAEAPVTVASA